MGRWHAAVRVDMPTDCMLGLQATNGCVLHTMPKTGAVHYRLPK